MKPSFRWNLKGFEQLRRSVETKARLRKEADAIAESAGDGYVSNLGEGKTRSRASVVTGTPRAMNSEKKNGNLLRVLGNRGV